MPLRLILTLTLALLAAPAAAHALPCTNCGIEPPPIDDPIVDPPVVDPGPIITQESLTYTLSVTSERGHVTDGSGLDCPGAACDRTLTYTRECTDGACPAYGFATVTLALQTVDGYTAKWDGCTPHADDPTRCDVLLDQDRAVNVLWTKGATPVDPSVVHDGGAVNQLPPAPGTIVSGTVETGTPAGQGKPGAIRSTLRYSFRRSEVWTEFTKLTARHVPAGAAVSVTCRGKHCPKGPLTLRKLTGKRFEAGTVFVVRITKPGRKAKVTRIAVRAGKDPRISHLK
jgi:hypothetical protein